MNRKAYYAEARRLTRRPRRHRYFVREVAETGPGTLWIDGVAYRVAGSTLTTVREVDPVTESWRINPPKSDFSTFVLPDMVQPSDCFCTDEPVPGPTWQITGECEGYLNNGSI